MDGIAVDSRRFAGGLPYTSSWRSGVDYVRADTGDDFDDAFDSVIRIEDIDLHKDGSVSIHLPEETPFQRGMNAVSYTHLDFRYRGIFRGYAHLLCIHDQCETPVDSRPP